MKQKISYLYVILGAFLIPILQLFVFTFRFKKLPISMVKDSIVFIPIGLISTFVLIYLLRTEEQEEIKKRILNWFTIGLPVSFITSLMSGLFNENIIFITIIGSLPLVLSTLIGKLKTQRQRIISFVLMLISIPIIIWIISFPFNQIN